MRRAIVTIVALLTVSDVRAQTAGVTQATAQRDEPAAAALFHAIRMSDVRAVKSSLERGASANARSDEGDTPLMYAAVHSTAGCMALLLERGADPNARDKRGGTALMRSVRDLGKVSLLLDRGAEVDARSELGVTALMVASNSPRASDVVKLLLARKADPRTADAAGIPTLMYATDLGDLETVKALVAAGADVKVGLSNLATPVFWAANGPLDVLVWLLEHGADPNAARQRDGMSPLMMAAGAGIVDNARALLDGGANVNAAGARGTPLIFASGSDLAGPAMIRLLLERGADPNAVISRCDLCIHEPRAADGSRDLTALMLARQRGETEIVRLLIAAGAKR
jgi:ankyrin repeat protein